MTARLVLRKLATRLFTDDLLGWSAQISYYFFLALFPALICLVALASFFPIEHFTDVVLGVLPRIAPEDVLSLVSRQLMVIAETRSAGLASSLHLSAVFVFTWRIVHWPLIFVLAVSGLSFVYTVGPDASHRWQCLFPGASVATLIWLGASLGLRWYVSSLATYEKTYGTIGTALVILLWFYVSGFAMLLGAELNSVMNEVVPGLQSPVPTRSH
jgi:uncharacterized BrkB/YihY/UPF0761 family membrane protein